MAGIANPGQLKKAYRFLSHFLPDLVFSQMAMAKDMTPMTMYVANNAFISYSIILNPIYDNIPVTSVPITMKIQ